MGVTLTDADRAMLTGACGRAAQMAMSIIVRMADVFGARELMDISVAHIDSTIYIGEAGLEFAERLASAGARVVVPTTLNVSGLDEHHWQEWAVPAEWARNAQRQMVVYQSMGAEPTWTCAPYQTEMKPRFGQQICWGESNAIAFANSVIGARTERYPDLLDICCAITGRVPAHGLHLTENRAGEILMHLIDVPPAIQREDSFYPVLGHLIGKVAQDRIPVIDGLSVQPTEDQLKALGAAAASSGTVALFHIVGVTPEAPTRDAAFQGRAPAQTIDVTMDALCAARRELTTADGEQLDMVVLGSPHFSLAEFKQLAPLVTGKRANPRVQFLVTSSRAMTLLAKQAGYLDALQAFGGKVTVDTCILASPMLPSEIKTLMTNSGKYAYYAPGMLNTRVTFGSLTDCVQSAVEGRVVRDESLWDLAPNPRPPSPSPDEVLQERGKGQGMGVRQHPVIPGSARGELLVSREPLSFWGGYDYHTGEII
ncbi:MAG TPA: aconitase X, partial [Anaerolineae bacterium]